MIATVATISAEDLARLEAAAVLRGVTVEELIRQLFAEELHKRLAEFEALLIRGGHDPR